MLVEHGAAGQQTEHRSNSSNPGQERSIGFSGGCFHVAASVVTAGFSPRRTNSCGHERKHRAHAKHAPRSGSKSDRVVGNDRLMSFTPRTKPTQPPKTTHAIQKRCRRSVADFKIASG